MKTWDALSVNVNRMKTIIEQLTKMCWIAYFCWSNRKNYWDGRKPHAQTVACSNNMEGHAQKCVERYCKLANKKVEQLLQSFVSFFLDWNTSSNRRNSNQLENYHKFAHILSWNACTWHELDELTSCGPWTSWQDQSIGTADFLHSSHKTISDTIVMWETRHSIVDWVWFKWWRPWGLEVLLGRVLCIFRNRTVVPIKLYVQEANIKVSRRLVRNRTPRHQTEAKQQPKRESESLNNCVMWIMCPPTHILLNVNPSCTFLKTAKLWSNW